MMVKKLASTWNAIACFHAQRSETMFHLFRNQSLSFAYQLIKLHTYALLFRLKQERYLSCTNTFKFKLTDKNFLDCTIA